MGKQKREEEARKAGGVSESGETHSNAGPGGEWPGGRKAGGDALTGGTGRVSEQIRAMDVQGNHLRLLLDGSKIALIPIENFIKEAWEAGRKGGGTNLTGSTAVEVNEDAQS